MTESFEDAIKALRHIARGNGAVMRIADRIVAAHERETKVEGVCGPITGELRAAMHQWGWVESDGSITFATSPMPPSIDAEQSLAISGSDFDRYCDAIDSIHAQLERENESLKAELDRVLGEYGNRDGLLQLPLDADRAPIFIGDVMESDYITRTEVAAVGIKCFFAWSNIDRRWHQYEANQFRHHAPDTWERILEDATALGAQMGRRTTQIDDLVSRCKKLAGDAE